MKVILFQKDINNCDYLGALEDISGLKPDLVCLGELATCGCLYNGGDFEDYKKVLESLDRFDFAVCLGLPRKVDGKVYNSYAYHKNGQTQFYNKINLFEPMNETTVYEKGDEIGIFETEFGRIGAAICYDIRFPEIFTRIKDAGADMILLPAAFPRIRIQDWRNLLVEHAKATGVPVIGINAVGDDNTNEFGGSSMVVLPDGEIIARADEINEIIIEVEL